jgi:hypothetical protein
MVETKKKKRGRPKIDPEGVVTQVRFPKDSWDGITRLAAKHNSSAAKEIRHAVRFWLNKQLNKPANHVGALATLISLLVQQIEKRTGKKWNEDALTGAAVAKAVDLLIFHFAPTKLPPPEIPRELESVPGELIAIAESLRPGFWENMHPEMLGDEWVLLARIINDVGSGWERNKEVWTGQKEGVK